MPQDEWYTPCYILEAVRDALGVIELDPFSSHEANKWVEAENYFTIEQDGFATDWSPHRRIWLNPPCSRGSMDKVMDKVKSLDIDTRVAMLCNFDHSTKWCRRALGHFDAVVLLSKRVRFVPGAGQKSSSNSKAQAIFYKEGWIDGRSGKVGALWGLGHVFLL